MNEIFPLEEVQAAYDRMMSGKARFRVVLKIELVETSDRHSNALETLGTNCVRASPRRTSALHPLLRFKLKIISNSIPLGRLGTPDDVAKAVVFLASSDGSYVTETELFVDGGFAQV